MTRARERLLLSGALELPRRSCEGANGTTMSWLAPALVGDLGELEQQLPPDAGLEGIVRVAVTGGEDVRCLLATPAVAAGLLRRGTGPERAPRRPPPPRSHRCPRPAGG